MNSRHEKDMAQLMNAYYYYDNLLHPWDFKVQGKQAVVIADHLPAEDGQDWVNGYRLTMKDGILTAEDTPAAAVRIDKEVTPFRSSIFRCSVFLPEDHMLLHHHGILRKNTSFPVHLLMDNSMKVNTGASLCSIFSGKTRWRKHTPLYYCVDKKTNHITRVEDFIFPVKDDAFYRMKWNGWQYVPECLYHEYSYKVSQPDATQLQVDAGYYPLDTIHERQKKEFLAFAEDKIKILQKNFNESFQDCFSLLWQDLESNTFFSRQLPYHYAKTGMSYQDKVKFIKRFFQDTPVLKLKLTDTDETPLSCGNKDPLVDIGLAGSLLGSELFDSEGNFSLVYPDEITSNLIQARLLSIFFKKWIKEDIRAVSYMVTFCF